MDGYLASHWSVLDDGRGTHTNGKDSRAFYTITSDSAIRFSDCHLYLFYLLLFYLAAFDTTRTLRQQLLYALPPNRIVLPDHAESLHTYSLV